MKKNAEAFQQIAACRSACRDLGQLDETLIQNIYNYLPPAFFADRRVS
jgi:hypothetical protein